MAGRVVKRSRGSRRSASPVPGRASPVSRLPILVVLALSLAGVAVSLLLARLHAQAYAGAESFCAWSETVSCDRVALSRYSVQAGLPVAVWGAFGYALMAALASIAFARRKPTPGWPAGLLLLLSGAAALASLALAAVSKVAIGVWCPLCVLSWMISFGLLAACWWACTGIGAGNAIRKDFSLLRARPLPTSVAALVILGGIGVTLMAYPRYWDRSFGARGPAVLPRTGPVAATTGAGSLVVYEYTDYECPYCARVYEERRTLAIRPGTRFVRRHFPLNPACNPAVDRLVHPSACDLARAAICAETQGRLAEMESLLFANQRERAPIESLARRAGLDMGSFTACLTTPETAQRLAADVEAGRRDGVRATPSLVVGGRVYAGTLPPEIMTAVDGNQH